MKQLSFPLLAIISLLLFSSCYNRVYVTNEFEEKTNEHQLIAVLPVAIEMNGVPNRPFEYEVKELIETKESLLFQRELFNEILRSTRNDRKPLRVDLQDYNTTLKKLEDADISIRDSWYLTSSELAELLGVDAVVRSKVEKNRYLSDAASYAISAFQSQLRRTNRNRGLRVYPPLSNSTGNIQLNISVFDANDTRTLWNFGRVVYTNWSRPANSVIRRCYRNISKKFPYRI